MSPCATLLIAVDLFDRMEEELGEEKEEECRNLVTDECGHWAVHNMSSKDSNAGKRVGGVSCV